MPQEIELVTIPQVRKAIRGANRVMVQIRFGSDEQWVKLSEKQIAYWRTPMKKGGMRIAIYWRQLLEEANAKAARKAMEA